MAGEAEAAGVIQGRAGGGADAGVLPEVQLAGERGGPRGDEEVAKAVAMVESAEDV